MEMDFDMQEKHLISTQIDNKTYEINATFSMEDCGKALEIERKSLPDYKIFLAEIIWGKIECDEETRPTIGRIESSEVITLFINTVISDSKAIREEYAKLDEISDKAERFITAVNKNTKYEVQKLRESLSKLVLSKIELPPVVSPVMPQINIPKNFFDSIIPDSGVLSHAIQSITRQIMDTSTITRAYQENIRSVLSVQQSFFKSITDQIVKTIPKIPSISISEESIENIRNAQRKWGDYGWTMPLHATARIVFTTPSDQAEANKIAMKYCTAEHMEDLFEKTRNKNGVRLKDFDEAVANYYDKRYRSCALLLFSFIDSHFIRMQRNSDRNNRGRRPVGISAAKTVFKHIKDEQVIENKIITIIRYENLYACMMKVFADGEDFKKQPDVINRNFLDHGMLTTRVRKRDCIQLFLLYYNWLSFIEALG